MLKVDRFTVNMVLRIFKMIAPMEALKCTEFVFERASAPHPTGGTYSAPPDGQTL